MLEVVLTELSPVCNAEQEFCVKFFHLATTVEEEPDQVGFSELSPRYKVRTCSDLAQLECKLPNNLHEFSSFL